MSTWSPEVVIPLTGSSIAAACLAVIAGMRVLDKYFPRKKVSDDQSKSKVAVNSDSRGGESSGIDSCFEHTRRMDGFDGEIKRIERELNALIAGLKEWVERIVKSSESTDKELFEQVRVVSALIHEVMGILKREK